MTETKEQQECPYCHDPLTWFQMAGTGATRFIQDKDTLGNWCLWRLTSGKPLFCSRRDSCVKCHRELNDDES